MASPFKCSIARFSFEAEVDKFFQRHWFSNPEAAKAAIDEIAGRYEADPFLLLGANDLRWM